MKVTAGRHAKWGGEARDASLEALLFPRIFSFASFRSPVEIETLLTCLVVGVSPSSQTSPDVS